MMKQEDLREAYRYCEWIASHHYENFPVASLLLAREKRPYVAAVYAFARSADDFADEAKYQGRSLQLLNAWREALRGRSPFVSHPIFLALADTIERYRLPIQLLDDLLTAFTMDVTKRRYADWQELLAYCRHSANPVGRLVLTIFGCSDEALHRLSDQICTGLQLANHWQDLRVDLAKDLLYIPQTLRDQFGVSEEELCSAGERGMTHPVRALMKDLVDRTDHLFLEGEPLLRRVSGPLRLELKLTVLGGRAILRQIRASGYDVFRRRPVLTGPQKIRLLFHGLLS